MGDRARAHKDRAKRRRKNIATAAVNGQAAASVTRKNDEEKSYAYFNVGKEFFAIDLDKVAEILHTFEIVPVPHLPESFSGVVKLRDESIPVLDLQKVLKEELLNPEVRPCLIINIGSRKMGFLVDSDIDTITESDVRLYPMPDCFSDAEIEFIDGILWCKNKFIGVLKPEELVKAFAD